jgi:hypothetical protein
MQLSIARAVAGATGLTALYVVGKREANTKEVAA